MTKSPLRKITSMVGMFPLILLCAMLLLGTATDTFASQLLHNSTNFPSPGYWNSDGGWGVKGGKYGEFTCKTCHGKRTGNIKRVLKNVAVLDQDAIDNGDSFPIQGDPGQQVIFLDTRNGTADFGDDTLAGRGNDMTKSDKICEACHSQTKYHRYNTTDTGSGAQPEFGHYNGQDCISCHKHKTGFTASCDNCHYSDKQLAVSHPVHFNSSTIAVGNYNTITSTQTEYIFQCGNCHLASGTSHATGDATPGVRSADIAISGGGNYSPGGSAVGTDVGPDGSFLYTDGTCSNLYCHSDGNGGAGNVDPQWTVSTMTCTSCHDDASALASGAHKAHVNNGAIMTDKSCETCHAVTTTNGTSIADKRLHVNKDKDINIAATYNLAGNFTFVQGADTCDNTYCHSDGKGTNNQVAWGNTINDCTSCHEGASAGTSLSGAHESHIFNSADFGRDLTCNECHETTASDNDTINDPSAHVDKLKTLNIANFGNAQADCTTSDCHSDGNYDSATDGGQGQQFNTPDWANDTYDCESCHGSVAQSVVYPIYNTPLGVDTADRNSHYKHVNDGNMDCGECHYYTSKTGTSLDGTDATKHVNRTVEVFFNTSGLNKDGVWTDASNSCSTTYCHGGATPEWGGVVNCGSCHEVNKNLPPSHAAHYNSTAQGDQTVATNNSSGTDYIFECGSCHDSVPHANGVTNVNFNSTYGGTFNGSDQCNNVYCHSDGNGGAGNQTPTWNSALPGLATCSSCHDQQPATFKHTAHVDDTKYDINCTECHRDTTLDGGSIVETAKHVNKVKDVIYNALNSGADAYVNGETNCSNLYCHSDGKGGAPNTTVQWNSATTLNCQGCHDGASNGTGLSIAHEAHIFNSADFGRDLTCNECHALTADNNSTLNSATGYVNHVDGFNSIRVANFGNAQADCTTADCHSDGNYDDTLVYQDAPQSWTDGNTLDCNDCHGDGTRAYPTYNTAAFGTEASTFRNSHYKHVNDGNMDCGECHYDTSKMGTALDGADATQHVDRTVDVVFNSSGLNASGNWTDASNTCSTTYCHGGSTPEWGGVVNCGSCHEVNKNLPPSHAVHYNSLAQGDQTVATNNSSGTDYIFECGSCHDSVPHANGVANVSFNSIYGGSFNGSDQCSNVYCHSDGNGGAGNAYRTPTWNSALAGIDDCTACHNNNASVDGKTMASGKHNAHVNSATIMANIGCVACHDATVSNDTTIADSSKHVNKTKDVLLSDTYNTGVFSYTDGTDNCSATYCHSDGKSSLTTDIVNWESDSSTGCNFCHGGAPNGATANDGGAGTALSDSHAIHVGLNKTDAFAQFSFGCEACHAATVSDSSTISDTAQHIDFERDVLVNDSYNATGGDFIGNSCSTTECHGSASPAWTDAATVSNGDCTACHGMTGALLHYNTAIVGKDTNGDTATSDEEVGAHVAHLSAANSYSAKIACTTCHIVPDDNTDSYYNAVMAAGHIDTMLPAELNFSGAAQYNGATSAYNVGSGTCTTTYCHDGGVMGKGLSGTLNDPKWNTVVMAGNSGDCDFCHGDGTGNAYPGGSHPTNNSCNNCHFNANATNDGFIDPSKHIDGVVDVDGGTTCTDCHGGGNYVDPDGKGDHGAHTNADVVLFGKTLDDGAGNSDYGVGSWWYDVSYNASGVLLVGCGQCHPATEVTHINSSVDVDMDPAGETITAPNAKLASAGAPGTPTYNSITNDKCSNVYCHSDGNGTWNESPAWNALTDDNSDNLGCDSCHGNSPSSGNHDVHAVGIHYETLYNGTTGLMATDGTTGSGAAHGDDNTADVINCQTCHNDTVNVTYNRTNNVCGTCHTADGAPAVGDEDAFIAFGSTTHLNAKPDVKIVLDNFKSRAQVRYNMASVTDLNTSWARYNASGLDNTAYKQLGSYDQAKAFAPAPSYNATNDNCSNVACHNGNTTTTWATPFAMNCASCHTSLPQ